MKRCVAPFTALLLGATLLGCAHRPAEEPRIYMLMGQSNMSGRGDMAALSPLERTVDPDILMLDNRGQWRVATEPIDDPEGESGAAVDRAPGVGPGMFFAREMRRRARAPIALVPCAKGGSAIAQWAPGDALFSNCLNRMRAARKHGRVAGILWYQGESDSQDADRPADWPGRFETLATRLRGEIGHPRLPIAVVVLADPPETGSYRYWRAIQEAQRAIQLPCLVTVPAAGVDRNPDRLHLSTAGQRVLGRRIAEALTSSAIDRRCR